MTPQKHILQCHQCKCVISVSFVFGLFFLFLRHHVSGELNFGLFQEEELLF